MTLSDIKAHVMGWAHSIGTGIDSEWHQAVTHFVNFLEGKQAEQDAAALLTAAGWTCLPPGSLKATGPVETVNDAAATPQQ